MKVTLECGEHIQSEEIIIKCRKMSDTIEKIVALASTSDQKLTGSIDRQIFILDQQEVFYFESVDDKVFICTKEKVYDSPLRLYEIEKQFAGTSFFRANKSTIVNLSLVRSLNPILNGKIEIELENGEKQIVSRQYAPELKQKLGIGR